jgi:hypothetical protein
MPGVSGEEKERAPPISGGFAKLPGVVPSASLEGLLPSAGNPNFGSFTVEPVAVDGIEESEEPGVFVVGVVVVAVVVAVMEWAFPMRVPDRRAAFCADPYEIRFEGSALRSPLEFASSVVHP